MKFSTLLALTLLLLVPPGPADDVEHYFRFLIRDTSELDRLTKIISIDDIRGDTVFAYANEREWEALLALGYRPTELPHPGSEHEHQMSDSPLGMVDWDRYPTYQAYLAMMRQYAADYPALCRLDTLGYSVQGRQILALKISDNVANEEDEPEFFYTSTMHGDETVGYVLLLRLADYLLTQYGQETPEGRRVTSLVDQMEIWINPLANPDGTYRLGGDTTVSNARRYNANGIDLNRNFPDRISDTVNTGAGRQPETQVFMAHARRRNFSLSANFHGGAAVVNYPWDNGAQSGTYSMCPDDQWFIALSRKYATPNPDIMSGGFPNGITNGCAWYAIFGGRQDWMYWWHGGRETTIELYNTKNPPGSVLPQRWLNNRESFLSYMEEALKGIRGIVRDATTLAPLRARIDVIGIPSVPVYTDSAVGNYHRLLSPGTYSLIAQATGYHPDTLRNIPVTDSAATRADFMLQRSTTGIAQSGRATPTSFSLSQNFPNPFNPATRVQFTVPTAGIVKLQVFDLLGSEVATLVHEPKEPGVHTVAWGAEGMPSGVYLVRMTAGNFSQTRKLVLVK